MQHLTLQVHACHETFAEATGGTVLPSDFVDDAIVASGTQVIVLSCENKDQ